MIGFVLRSCFTLMKGSTLGDDDEENDDIRPKERRVPLPQHLQGLGARSASGSRALRRDVLCGARLLQRAEGHPEKQGAATRRVGAEHVHLAAAVHSRLEYVGQVLVARAERLWLGDRQHLSLGNHHRVSYRQEPDHRESSRPAGPSRPQRLAVRRGEEPLRRRRRVRGERRRPDHLRVRPRPSGRPPF